MMHVTRSVAQLTAQQGRNAAHATGSMELQACLCTETELAPLQAAGVKPAANTEHRHGSMQMVKRQAAGGGQGGGRVPTHAGTQEMACHLQTTGMYAGDRIPTTSVAGSTKTVLHNRAAGVGPSGGGQLLTALPAAPAGGGQGAYSTGPKAAQPPPASSPAAVQAPGLRLRGARGEILGPEAAGVGLQDTSWPSGGCGAAAAGGGSPTAGLPTVSGHSPSTGQAAAGRSGGSAARAAPTRS